MFEVGRQTEATCSPAAAAGLLHQMATNSFHDVMLCLIIPHTIITEGLHNNHDS